MELRKKGLLRSYMQVRARGQTEKCRARRLRTNRVRFTVGSPQRGSDGVERCGAWFRQGLK